MWVVYDRHLVAEHLPDGVVHLRKPTGSLGGGTVLSGFEVSVSDVFE